MAIFKVTPHVEDFRLVVSMKVTYDMGHGEMVVDIMKGQKVRITVYGKSVREKDPNLYAFIKDSVDVDSEGPMHLLRFDFLDPPEGKVERMKVKYGLWEGAHDSVRHESEFDFVVEPLGQ